MGSSVADVTAMQGSGHQPSETMVRMALVPRAQLS
jgi:hypothetical protein